METKQFTFQRQRRNKRPIVMTLSREESHESVLVKLTKRLGRTGSHIYITTSKHEERPEEFRTLYYWNESAVPIILPTRPKSQNKLDDLPKTGVVPCEEHPDEKASCELNMREVGLGTQKEPASLLEFNEESKNESRGEYIEEDAMVLDETDTPLNDQYEENNNQDAETQPTTNEDSHEVKSKACVPEKRDIIVLDLSEEEESTKDAPEENITEDDVATFELPLIPGVVVEENDQRVEGSKETPQALTGELTNEWNVENSPEEDITMFEVSHNSPPETNVCDEQIDNSKVSKKRARGEESEVTCGIKSKRIKIGGRIQPTLSSSSFSGDEQEVIFFQKLCKGDLDELVAEVLCLDDDGVKKKLATLRLPEVNSLYLELLERQAQMTEEINLFFGKAESIYPLSRDKLDSLLDKATTLQTKITGEIYLRKTIVKKEH